MGHVRLGRLPRTRRWQQVVELLGGDAPIGAVAAASAAAAEAALRGAHADPGLGHAFWLLMQVPLAARASDLGTSLSRLGFRVPTEFTLLSIIGAFSDAVERHVQQRGGRTDLGEMAQLAAAEALTSVVGRDLPSLFGTTPGELKLALARLAAPDRFAGLAREFFARCSRKYLDYFVSRELSNHVGPGRRIGSIDAHTAFDAALERHCQETALIVEAFAGGWYSKARFKGELTPEKAQRFAYVALRKLQSELRKRSEPNA
jgi:hypothetical protein